MNFVFEIAPWDNYWTQWKQLFAPLKELLDNAFGQFMVSQLAAEKSDNSQK